MNDNSNPRCSMVIRCYNEEQHIGRLLVGVMEQTVKDVEIILMDSGSTDATLSIASRYPVKILSIKPEEFSFGRSLNMGCAEATREFIVLVSAHVYPEYKDWLENLLAPFNDSDVALVYGKQRAEETAKYSEHQVYNKWYPKDSVVQQRYPFCNNANAAIRCSLWERLPYDEALTGLEDLDWAKRVIKLGKKIVYNAEAEVIHVHNENYSQVYNRYRREAIAFKQIYPHERFHMWDFLRLFTANVLTDYYHAWHDRILTKNLLGISCFRLMQFWGTFRGFAQQGHITSHLRNRFYYPNDLTRGPVISKREKEKLINYEHH